jgi:mRNA interferase HicA
MKKRDLEQRLRALGWYLLREGTNHEIWTNGQDQTIVPRHREVNELTARGILRLAERTRK